MTATTYVDVTPADEPAFELRRRRTYETREIVRMAWYAGRGWSASRIGQKIGTSPSRVRAELRRHGVEISGGIRRSATMAVEVSDVAAAHVEDIAMRVGVCPERLAALVIEALDRDEIEILARRPRD